MDNLDERYDEILMTLAGQHGALEPLLKTFFSFLHRKTDFYMVHPETDLNARMGFTPGSAEKLLLRAFHSFPYKNCPTADGGLGTKQKPKTQKKTAASESKAKESVTVQELPPESKPETETEDYSEQQAESKSEDVEDVSPVAPCPPGNQFTVRYTEEGLQIPIGHGGVTDKYYWTQTIDEVTVYVDLPPGTKSKDLDVQIKRSSLRVKMKSEQAPMLEGEFPHTASGDCIWTLEDHRTLIMTLEKEQKTWWRSVLKGDQEIDAQKVDSTSKVEDYDPQTQATIRKIMFDQKQKALGLPTSEELKMNSILEQAKFSPGSPFLPGGAYEGQDLTMSR